MDESNTKIPDAVIEALSDQLPSGFEYTQIDKETIGVAPTTEQMNMKIKLKYPDDFEPKSSVELMEYLYRAQQELTVPTNTIEINGHTFTSTELFDFPLTDTELSIDDFKLIIKPSPFPDPFQIYIELENEEVTKKYFQIKRQPYADMAKSLFKSIDNGPLNLSYIIDEQNHSLSLTINLNINKSFSPKEAVEAYKIYDGFIQGKIKFNGANLNAVPNINEDLESIKEIIKLWEKVDLIGEKLDLDFKLNDNLSQNDILWIEKLYRSFIEEQPYKEYLKVDKLTTEIFDIDKDKLINSEGFALQFTNNEEIELLGKKMILYNLVALFDLKVIDIIEKNDQKYEFKIGPTTDDGVYKSIKHFINNDEMNSYKPSEVLQEFQNAETIGTDITT